MIPIKARNVHAMLPAALVRLNQFNITEDSRNGPVVRFPGPVCLEYFQPEERVIFWPARDANPFFHFFECLWMMAGSNTVDYVKQFSKNMGDFSDNGLTFNGAYGHRWRKHFGLDQIDEICCALVENPGCRRQVLSMWDGHHDLGLNSKDIPCNTHAYFQVTEIPDEKSGTTVLQLDMTVCNRSNDLVWGATGANAVHFSFLQEWMARAMGMEIGRYWQFSNNMHLYTERHGDLFLKLGREAYACPYLGGLVESYPVMNTDPETWFSDLAMFMVEGPVIGLRDSFFRRVATPMLCSFQALKKTSDPNRFLTAITIMEQCMASDWRRACTEWLIRQKDRAMARQIQETAKQMDIERPQEE